MTIEFVLNVSLLEKFFSSHESQRLDSAMSTICHIAILQGSTKNWTFVRFMTVVLEILFDATLVA